MGAEKLKNAKESLNRFETVVKEQVNRAMADERKQSAIVKRELDELKRKYSMLQEENADLNIKRANLEDKLKDA